MDGSRPARRRATTTGRVVRAGAAAVAAGAAALLAVSVQRVWWPAQSEPDAVDAVVVLGGGRGERHDRAMELIDAGVADTLVVSAVSDLPRLRRRIEDLCAGPTPFEVVCFVPEPGTTRGEAAFVAGLIEDRGWRSIALVTTDFHLDRATVTFRACTDATVHPIAARGPRRADWVAKEIVGFTYVRTVARACLPPTQS